MRKSMMENRVLWNAYHEMDVKWSVCDFFNKIEMQNFTERIVDFGANNAYDVLLLVENDCHYLGLTLEEMYFLLDAIWLMTN